MKKKLLSFIERYSIAEVYVLIPWPDAQDFMEEPWFQNECVLHQVFDDNDYLTSAYFVPVRRLLK